MTAATRTSTSYVLGDSEAESRRLAYQAQVVEPFTRHVLAQAGISAGMSVLDVGSGAGDVAMLLAELVGPTGRVVGVDRNDVLLATATRRAGEAGHGNVRFLVGDAGDPEADFGDGFDAVVGRMVLKFNPDPTATLRALAQRVAPGGVVAFQEADFSFYCHSVPETAAMAQVREWIGGAFAAGGIDPEFGFKLPRLYAAAGLPRPELRYDTYLGSGPAFGGYRLAADTVRSLLPVLESAGVTTAAEADVATLADRLRSASVEADATVSLISLVGAWTRLPGGGHGV